MGVLRWTARILGLFIVGLVVLFAIGEGFDPAKLDGTELVMSAAFFTALLGMVVLWRWEGIGGAMVVGGMLAFDGLNFAASGRFPGGWVFLVCYLPGIFVLVSKRRFQFRLRTLLLILSLAAVGLGIARWLGPEILPFVLAVVGMGFSTRMQSRTFFVWLVPLLWSICAFGSWHHPGDEYGLFAVSILPSLWLAFLLEYTHLSEVYLLLIAAGALSMTAFGFILDRLAVPRRLWVAFYVGASVGLLSWGLLAYPSLKAAIAKNGSILAYAFSAANLGLCLSVLSFLGVGTIPWLWRRVRAARKTHDRP